MTTLDTIAPWSKSLLDLAAYGLVITDTNLVIREWSPWMEQHSGLRAAQVVGRPLLELYPELAQRQLAKRYHQALTGQVSVLAQRLHGYLLPLPAPPGQELFEHMQQTARIGPLNGGDEVVGTLTIIEDVTDRVIAETELKRLLTVEQTARIAADRARRRASFLAEASVTLAATDDYRAAIVQVVQLAVPDLADWCAVNMLAPGDTIELLGFASIDPQINQSVRELRERYPMRLSDPHGAAKVLRTGECEYLPRVPADFMIAGVHDAEQLALLHTIALESYLCVPLRLGQRVLGALSWASRLPGHHYTTDDLVLAEELAHRIALAIDRVQRYAAEQAARQAAEAAEQRMSFLANLGEQLAATLDYQQTLHTLASLTVPQIADWCVVHELDEQGQPQAALIVAGDPAKTEQIAQLQQRYAADPHRQHNIAMRAISQGEPVLIAELGDRWPAQIAAAPELAEQLRQLRPYSVMSVPLQARGRTLGALTFVVESPQRRYGPPDLNLAIELGRRVALALDNAQLYRAAQAALARSDEARALLDALINSAPVGLAFLDRELRYVQVNPLLAEINGQSIEAHLGRSIPDVLPDLASALVPLFSHVLTTGQPLIDVEVLGETPARPNDERAWHERIYPVYTSGGELLGIGAIVLEVTERKRAEQQVRRANERLKLALDAVNGFIYDYDLQQRTVERSAEFVKVTGYWPDDVPASADWWGQQIHPDDQPRVLRQGRYAREHDDYHSTEYRVRHKDGHYIYVWDRAMALRDLSGKVVRLVGSTIDITERRQAELEREQLLAREQLARQTAETTAERISRLQAVTAALSESLTPEQVAEVMIQHGTVALDATRCWFSQVGADERTLELVHALGFTPEQIEQRRSTPISADLPLAEAVRSGHSIWVETLAEQQARYPDTTAQYHSTGTWVALPLIASGRTVGAVGFHLREFRPVAAEDRNFLFGLAQQCAQALERARLYDAERRALAAAQEAVRMRDIFFSVASHELRTPLTALLGQAQLLQRRLQQEPEPNPRNLRSVQVVTEQSLRLNRMVGAMLDVSRIETGQLSIARAPVELVLLTRRVLDEIVPMMQDHTIEAELTDEPLILDGDELRLEQVLHNLINNAAKYSPEGGLVHVRVARAGSQAQITVTDHGIGIPLEAQQRLFERFYRAGNAQELNIKGMGIGLYLVNEIIGLHGGQISVRSAEGQGSTFSILLPLRPS